MNTKNTPNIIQQRPPVLFDILVEHNPPGTTPEDRESVEEVLRIHCWVKKISAHTPDEAGRKAQMFLESNKGVTNIQVVKWRFFSGKRERKEVVAPDGECTMTGLTDDDVFTRCGHGWCCDEHEEDKSDGKVFA